MQRNRERGIGFVTVIVGIGLLLIVAIAAVYLSSDVFRTKADAAYRQFAEWTPENIAKNPLGYDPRYHFELAIEAGFKGFDLRPVLAQMLKAEARARELLQLEPDNDNAIGALRDIVTADRVVLALGNGGRRRSG